MPARFARPTALIPAALVLSGLLMASACSEDDSPSTPYDPDLPTAWAAAVTNPWFPLAPGTTWTYRGETDEGVEEVVVEVLAETRTVNGVTARVVHDRVYVDGELAEDTRDWYAQDADGNVWYLGEVSEEVEDGEVVGTEGSWEWGVDGALPGVIMWADPASHVGEEYRQEFYEDEAEDWGKVLAVGESVTVPSGAYDDCVRTEDWNALESGAHETKWYCAGVGFVRETTEGESVELVSVTP